MAGKRAKKLMREEMDRRFHRLAQFLGGHLHQDWFEDYGTPETAMDYAIAEYSIELRQEVRQQLVTLLEDFNEDQELCNILNDGLGVCVYFRKPRNGRTFAEDVERRLKDSIKAYFDSENSKS